jgi:hypothetical protein
MYTLQLFVFRMYTPHLPHHLALLAHLYNYFYILCLIMLEIISANFNQWPFLFKMPQVFMHLEYQSYAVFWSWHKQPFEVMIDPTNDSSISSSLLSCIPQHQQCQVLFLPITISCKLHPSIYHCPLCLSNISPLHQICRNQIMFTKFKQFLGCQC